MRHETKNGTSFGTHAERDLLQHICEAIKIEQTINVGPHMKVRGSGVQNPVSNMKL